MPHSPAPSGFLSPVVSGRVDTPLPASLEGKIVQERRGPELAGIGKIVAELVPPH